MLQTFFRLFCALVFLLPQAGCREEPLEFTEVKRVDEAVTGAELDVFLRLIDSVPKQQLPPFPPLFAPPPEWDESTLPVSELVSREERLIREHRSVAALARSLERNRPLQRALERERMTPEQFTGLSLALGAALSYATLREEQVRDLDRLIARGESVLRRLRQENRTFSTLRDEQKYAVLEDAVWLTRLDRAAHLKLVPSRNVELVKSRRERLVSIFPESFRTNPLDTVADILEERGVPFEELPESGSDDTIEWSRDDAIVGTDPERVTSLE